MQQIPPPWPGGSPGAIRQAGIRWGSTSRRRACAHRRGACVYPLARRSWSELRVPPTNTPPPLHADRPEEALPRQFLHHRPTPCYRDGESSGRILNAGSCTLRGDPRTDPRIRSLLLGTAWVAHSTARNRTQSTIRTSHNTSGRRGSGALQVPLCRFRRSRPWKTLTMRVCELPPLSQPVEFSIMPTARHHVHAGSLARNVSRRPHAK